MSEEFDDSQFGEGLPAEEDYVEESEVEEVEYDFGSAVDDEEEDEEEDDSVEEETSEPFEIEEEPYPDEEKRPWELEQVEEHFYNVALYEVLKQQGIDTTNKGEVTKALNAAWANNFTEMKAFDERLKKDAAKETAQYKKNVYDPWHEQYENARISEEFQEALDYFPEIMDYIEEIQVIGPEFFKHNPKLQNSPAKALPVLLNIVKQLGRIGDDDETPKKKTFSVEKGRRSRPAPQREKSRSFSNKIESPGDWVLTL